MKIRNPIKYNYVCKFKLSLWQRIKFLFLGQMQINLCYYATEVADRVCVIAVQVEVEMEKCDEKRF